MQTLTEANNAALAAKILKDRAVLELINACEAFINPPAGGEVALLEVLDKTRRVLVSDKGIAQ